MIVGFTGTQRGMTDAQIITFAHLIKELQIKEIHHGDCIGADVEAHYIVRDQLPDCRIVGHPPDNPSKRAFCEVDEEKDKLPYLKRNQKIVDAAELLIATPREDDEVLFSGTWATIRRARKASTPVGIILPNGKIEQS